MFSLSKKYLNYVIFVLLSIQFIGSHAGFPQMINEIQTAKDELVQAINITKDEINMALQDVNMPQFAKKLSKLDVCYNMMFDYTTNNKLDVIWAMERLFDTVNQSILSSVEYLDTVILCAKQQNIHGVEEAYQPITDDLKSMIDTIQKEMYHLINETEDLGEFVTNITDILNGCLRFVRDIQQTPEPSLLITKVISYCFDQSLDFIIPKCRAVTFDVMLEEESIIRYLEERNDYIRENFRRDIEKVHNRLLMEKNFDVETCANSILKLT